METWIEKYRPKFFSEIVGQEEAIAKTSHFLRKFKEDKNLSKKAIFFYGQSGTGKTTLAHAVANETNSEIFELNASDLRDKSKLKEILKPATEQKSLYTKEKIIFIDEADGISGTDKGGISELASILSTTEYPVIINARDVWDKKFNQLRKNCEIIEFKTIDYRLIREVLIKILKKEKKFIEHQIITNISVKAKGDLRAAINDLQAISDLNADEAKKIFFDERDKEKTIFEAMKKVFKLKPTNETLEIFDSVEMPLDEIILWIEKNLPLEYRDKELARAFDLVSRADIFKKRVHKQQYWRFLVYENSFLSYGVSSAKKENLSGFSKYKKPTRILKIWMNNQKTSKKKTIAEKYAKHCHISTRKAMQDFPIIEQIIKSNPKISEELKLDEDELSYLKT